jgi:hypothetical protein
MLRNIERVRIMVASQSLLKYYTKAPTTKGENNKKKVFFMLLGREHYEAHTVTHHVPNHNKNGEFPRFSKVTEKISEENCCQLSLRSALQGLHGLKGNTPNIDESITRMWEGCTRDHFQRVVETRLLETINKRTMRGIPAPGTKTKRIFVNGKKKQVQVYDLPSDVAKCYGSQAEGYKGGDLVNYVRELNEIYCEPLGDRMIKIESITRLPYKQLLKLTAKRRKGRVFVMFGRSGSTEKRKELVEKAHLSQLCCHTKKLPYLKGFMPQNYYESKAQMPEHAICVKYDQEGNGTMDDPAKKIYRGVTLENLYEGLVDLHYVYELSLVNK